MRSGLEQSYKGGIEWPRDAMKDATTAVSGRAQPGSWPKLRNFYGRLPTEDYT
jgi:hypothetical protein